MGKQPKVAVTIAATDEYTAAFQAFQKTVAETKRQLGSLQAPMQASNEAASAMSRGIEGTLQAVRAGATATASALSRLPGAAGLVGLGTVAGAGAAIQDFSRLGMGLERTSKLAGMSVTSLNSVRGAARMIGMDAETAETNMVGLQRAMQDAVYGKNPAAARLFNMLGIDVGNIRDGVRSTEAILPRLSNIMRDAYARNPSDAVAAGAIFGLDERGVALLARGADEMKRLMDTANRATPFGPKEAAAAERYAESLGNLTQAGEGLRNMLVTRLEPSFTPVIKGFTEMIEKQTETKEGADKLSAALLALAGGGLFTALFGRAAAGTAARVALGGMGGAVTLPLALTGDTDKGATPEGFLPGWKPNNDDSSSMGAAIGRFFSSLFGGGSAPNGVMPTGPRFGAQGFGPANPAAGLAVDRQAAAKASYDFWRGKGYTPAGAASMASMEMGESGGDVAARGDGNRSHGLYQHDPNRRAAIKASEGIDLSTETDADRQREGVYQEGRKGLDAGAGRAFRTISTTNDLQAGVESGVNDFERSADRAGDIRKRLAIAKDILRLYGPGSENARAEEPDLTRGGRIQAPNINAPTVGSAAAAAPLPPATVRVDIMHNNVPEGVSVGAGSDSDWTSIGRVEQRMNVQRAMPARDYARGY